MAASWPSLPKPPVSSTLPRGLRHGWDGGSWHARVPISSQRFESPAQMQAVLVAPGMAAGTQVGFAIAGSWPALAAPGGNAVAAPMRHCPARRRHRPRWVWPSRWPLLSLGGMLLNLMPCVFPILSLKLLGFAGHAHSRRALLAGGLAYSAGVVLSFVALAALLLVLRAGGEQIGWGFQLQSPGFIAALAVLFTLDRAEPRWPLRVRHACCRADWPRCACAIRWPTRH